MPLQRRLFCESGRSETGRLLDWDELEVERLLDWDDVRDDCDEERRGCCAGFGGAATSGLAYGCSVTTGTFRRMSFSMSRR